MASAKKNSVMWRKILKCGETLVGKTVHFCGGNGTLCGEENEGKIFICGEKMTNIRYALSIIQL